MSHDGHEIDTHQTWPQALETPEETWCRCVCGEEMDSQASAGGTALSVPELFALHLDELNGDTA